MLGSVGAVTALVVFCYYKVLTTTGSEDKMHAPLDIDTGDVE